MFGLFTSKSPAPQAGDRVEPMHFFDDGALWRAFLLYSWLVFDEALDPKLLRSSLEKLITEKEGWSKLGSRLRKDTQGNLEYHIPSTFSSARSPLTYTETLYDCPASEHPLASQIPHASTTPSIVSDPDAFEDLLRPVGSPTKLSDYINADIPQLGLHIVSFKDKTLVTLYWPHTLFDAMGKSALLEAWSLVVQGRADEVKTPHGWDSDPFTKLGTAPTEEHKLQKQRMGTFGLMGYGVGQVGDFMAKKENRMVCVPDAFVQKLRESAIAELAASREKQEDREQPFLSEGDVLCAWWTRFATAHLPPDSRQTVVLNNAYDIRKPLTGDVFPAGAIYLSNAIAFINVVLSVQDIRTKPLSHVASAIRSAIQDLGTRAQVEAFFAMVRESSAKLPPFFGDRGMHMVTYSNWSKAKLFDVDFSAAIVGESTGPGSGRPKYIQNCQFGLTMPNAFLIAGKDGEGNYWLSGYLVKGHWDRIGEMLEKEV